MPILPPANVADLEVFAERSADHRLGMDDRKSLQRTPVAKKESSDEATDEYFASYAGRAIRRRHDMDGTGVCGGGATDARSPGGVAFEQRPQGVQREELRFCHREVPGICRQIPGARRCRQAYGLALTLLEGPEKKYDELRDLMQALAGSKEFDDRALAAYYAGVANRGLGLQELARAEGKTAEADRRRAAALARFNEAIPFYTSASKAFMAKLGVPSEGDDLSLAAEWVARRAATWRRCSCASGNSRKPRMARPFVERSGLVAQPLSQPGALLPRLRQCFAQGRGPCPEIAVAAGAVRRSGVRQPRPLSLVRTHHLADERAEATTHYEGTIGDYVKSKAEAIKLLKQPEKFKNDAETKAAAGSHGEESGPRLRGAAPPFILVCCTMRRANSAKPRPVSLISASNSRKCRCGWKPSCGLDTARSSSRNMPTRSRH